MSNDENPIAAAMFETESHVANSRANARKRKWWLYAKLSSMRTLAEESKVDFESLRPVKIPVLVRLAARMGGKASLFRIAAEETKREQRASLARAFWAEAIVRGPEPTKGRRGEIKPKSRDVDVLVVPVHELVLEDGDVMLATWAGPPDEDPDLCPPTW